MHNESMSRLKKISRLERTCALILLIYLTVAAVFYYAAAIDWDVQGTTSSLMSPQANMGVMSGDVVIEQAFTPSTQTIDRVEPVFSLIGDVTDRPLAVEIEQNGTVLGRQDLLLSDLKGGTYAPIAFGAPVRVQKGEPLIIRFLMPGLTPENGVTMSYGDMIPTARGSMAVDDSVVFSYSGQPVRGMLALNVVGQNYYYMSRTYLIAAACVFVLLILTMVHQIHKFRSGQSSWIIRLITVLDRYRYLIAQMVSRDFHIKYKRSVLGVVWSFLNPILTMTVCYFVFSTLFKNTTENFLLYLLTGIVTFNYFNEASSMGLGSIVGNASLITKVYVPKFIYPVVPVFSATVNMLFSLIPVLLVMLFTGVAFTKAVLLLPLAILFVMTFSVGMSMILSTAMVFFRDTKFLWGVLSMLWNFLTPIFYTEAQIPQAYIGLYRTNPMYQFVYFMRSILINGVSPNPQTYLYCILAAGVPLILGLFLFKKSQDKFAFNL